MYKISPLWFFLLSLSLTLPCYSAQQQEKPKPGAIKKIEIADKVFMEFCYIPPGESKLGSTADERNSIEDQVKNYKFRNTSLWLWQESVQRRGTFKSKGFWLGKYEVTQEEWKAIMGDKPSFLGTVRAVPEGVKWQRLPVTSVSWDRCQKFMEKLNKLPEFSLAFGKGSKCVLPHEDEWEYAYRGGKGNERPFYWGIEWKSGKLLRRVSHWNRQERSVPQAAV